jgi:hypothetical protein
VDVRPRFFAYRIASTGESSQQVISNYCIIPLCRCKYEWAIPNLLNAGCVESMYLVTEMLLHRMRALTVLHQLAQMQRNLSSMHWPNLAHR